MLRLLLTAALLSAAAPAFADQPVTDVVYPSWVFPKFDPAKALEEEKITQADLDTIAKGEVIVRSRPIPKGKPGTHVVAVALVDAPQEVLFDVLMDCVAQIKFVPHLVECKNTYAPGDDPKTAVRYKQYQALKFGFGFVSKSITYTNNMFALRPHVSGWVLDKGDIDKSDGYWRVIPHQGKSILLYDVYSNPGMAVPDWVQEILVKSDLPNTVEAMRKRAETLAKKAGK